MAVGSFKLPSNAVNMWKRPADWLVLPELSESDERFVGLYAVYPEGLNAVAFSFNTSVGQYEVDWGDGMVQLFNSGIRAEHTYNYATVDADVTADGFKQCIISVVPVTGVFEQCNFQQLPTGQAAGFVSNFIDMEMAMPHCLAGVGMLLLGGVNVVHAQVKRVRVRNCGDATHLQELYLNMHGLEVIYLFDTSLVTDMQQMHRYCYSLQYIPAYHTTNVLEVSYFADSCYSLLHVPDMDFANATDASSMFYGCRALADVNISSMPALVYANQMFNECYALETLPNFITVSVIYMGYIATFSGAIHIPLWDTSNCTTMDFAFFMMKRLRKIPALDLGASTSNTGFARHCSALVWCDAININASIDFENCALSRAAIVNIFNNLVDRSATTQETIILTGNWGVATLSGADILIATNKNWSVTL